MTRLKAIIENIRTNGKDPAYRKSLIISAAGHLLVLFVIPWMLNLRGCVVGAPFPDDINGKALGERLRSVKITKVVVRKKIITRHDENSPIVWAIPDFSASDIPVFVEEFTQVRYSDYERTDPHAPDGSGKRGSPDSNGKMPGLPGGTTDGKFHFVRLEYNGEDWDDGMDSTDGADRNFLAKFRELTGVSRIAKRGESLRIRDLAKYRAGEAPPFVYMTGSGTIEGISEREVRILRDYLRRGGMLFADCGSTSWNRSFIAFARRVLPGIPFSDISDDDPIFTSPYRFPDGAPSYWHHGGFKAKGMKFQGRWAVFYHPGDLNDAWKTGRSGISREMAESAHKMGVNIAWYASKTYLAATRKRGGGK